MSTTTEVKGNFTIGGKKKQVRMEILIENNEVARESFRICSGGCKLPVT